MRSLRGKIYLPLAIAFSIGAGLRLAVMVAVYPAIYFGWDLIRYARIWPRNLFEDCWMPAGYPFILQILRGISNQIALVITLQHFAGLGVGLFGFALARRLGAPRPVAVATALPALLSGDLLFIEHAVATEPFFNFLLAASLVAVATGITRRSMTALALGSCLLGLSTLVRSIATVLPLAFALGVIFALWRSPRLCLRALAIAVVPAVVIVRAYAAIVTSIGGFPGLTEMNGFYLYSRVAPVADCARFRPPKRAEVLCETRPASKRPGPFFYGGSEESPSRRHFEVPGALYGIFTMDPRNNALFREFALGAVTHQPLDYVHEVAVDLGRYFVPSLDQRAWIAWGPEYYDFRADKLWTGESFLEGLLSNRYQGTQIHRRRVLLGIVGAYASFVRLNGAVLALTLVGSLVGIALTRNPAMRGVLILLLSTGAALLVVPVLVSSYDYRYGFPAQVPLGWAAVLGGWTAVSRWRHRTASTTSPKAEPLE